MKSKATNTYTVTFTMPRADKIAGSYNGTAFNQTDVNHGRTVFQDVPSSFTYEYNRGDSKASVTVIIDGPAVNFSPEGYGSSQGLNGNQLGIGLPTPPALPYGAKTGWADNKKYAVNFYPPMGGKGSVTGLDGQTYSLDNPHGEPDFVVKVELKGPFQFSYSRGVGIPEQTWTCDLANNTIKNGKGHQLSGGQVQEKKYYSWGPNIVLPAR